MLLYTLVQKIWRIIWYTEKLEFLEKYACPDASVLKLKIRNEKIKRNEGLTSSIAVADTLTNVLEHLENPGDLPPFPIAKVRSQISIDRATENRKIRIKKLSNKLQLLKSKIELLKSEHEKSTRLTEKIIYIDTNIKRIEDQIYMRNNEISEVITRYMGDEVLEEMNIQLQTLKSNREFNQLLKEIEDYKVQLRQIEYNFDKEKEIKLEEIDSHLWKDMDEKESIALLSEYEELIVVLNEIKDLKDFLQTVNHSLEKIYYIYINLAI